MTNHCTFKQSSIEYLAEKHDKLVRWMEGDAKAEPYSFTDFDADLKIAREMHRNEIEECSSENYSYGFYDGEEGVHLRQESSENYYTETFQQHEKPHP